jgi:DtxR family transcriptional regulator, Mn-dependent transcriptional regulator
VAARQAGDDAVGATRIGWEDNDRVTDLIDTTEMYLRTIFELEEEGVVALRARIAERLGQSGPTVSQTVARMERDGLLRVQDDRHLELSPEGRAMATRVMRKHRLAECLLVEVIGMPWEDVHAEACRWEHVMSESVERRILELLGHPTVSPYGNPIPGLAELGDPASDGLGEVLVGLDKVASEHPRRVLVRRLGEPLQTDSLVMARLRRAGVTPGEVVKVQTSDGGFLVGSGMQYAEVGQEAASHIFVSA